MRTALAGRAQGGFTLIELMVVIAIGALLLRLAVANLGALIPAWSLDSESNLLVSKIDFLRSESRLQSAVYHLELDLTNNRYQVILPPEKRLETTEAQKLEREIGWTLLNDRVEFMGYQVVGGSMLRRGLVRIRFDENGFTADQSIFLRLKTDEKMIWTLRVRGLTGHTEITKSMIGKLEPLPLVEEAAF